MKRTYVFGLGIFLLVYLPAFAQSDTPSTRSSHPLGLASLYVQASRYTIDAGFLESFSAFGPLAEGSALLKNDFTGYFPGIGYGNNGWFGLSILGGFQLSKALPGLELRAGLTRNTVNLITGGMAREEKHRYDTLRSAQTGEDFMYLDSENFSRYDAQYKYAAVGLDLSVSYTQAFGRHWTAFAGAGFAGYISTNTRTEITYESSTYLYGRLAGDSLTTYWQDFSRQEGKPEAFKNKMNTAVMPYMSAGAEFRLSRKNELFSRIYLRYEARPSYYVLRVPELQKVYYRLALGHLLGIRYAI